MSLRLVSYNIRFGGGRRVALLADVLGALDADLVVLQEATDARVVDRLGDALGLPHRLRRSGWSVAAMAREAPTSFAWHEPPHGRGFLTVTPGGTDLRVAGVHLTSGLSARGELARMQQVEGLLTTLEGTATEQTVIVGDLNAVAHGDEPLVAGMPLWLRVLLRFDGGIRTDVLERLRRGGWRDAYRRLHPTDPGFTLPAPRPQVRLDYLLAPEALLPRIRICEPVREGPLIARASDHLPLLAVIEPDTASV